MSNQLQTSKRFLVSVSVRQTGQNHMHGCIQFAVDKLPTVKSPALRNLILMLMLDSVGVSNRANAEMLQEWMQDEHPAPAKILIPIYNSLRTNRIDMDAYILEHVKKVMFGYGVTHDEKQLLLEGVKLFYPRTFKKYLNFLP